MQRGLLGQQGCIGGMCASSLLQQAQYRQAEVVKRQSQVEVFEIMKDRLSDPNASPKTWQDPWKPRRSDPDAVYWVEY